MEISYEYLKMVMALPEELFEGWGWTAGDKALVNNEIWTVFGGNTNGMVVLGENLQQFSIGNLDFSYKIGDKAKPIPSQEQLQELIQKHWSKLDPTVQSYGVVKYFCNWFHTNWVSYPAYKEVENESINSIWLRYTMWMIYEKEWNGESWI